MLQSNAQIENHELQVIDFFVIPKMADHNEDVERDQFCIEFA